MDLELDPENILHKQSALNNFQITQARAQLYAVSIGISDDPNSQSDLRYTYEDSENFSVFPTILSTSLMWSNPLSSIMSALGLGDEVVPKMLHAGLEIIFNRPLMVNEIITPTLELDGIKDIGKATLTRSKFLFMDEQNQPVATYYSTSYIKGMTAKGFQSEGFDKNVKIPKTDPTKVIEYQTTANQALIYRLNGDLNPLHADTNQAQQFGFNRPILHGLCFFGIANRLILKEFGDNDASRLKSSTASFLSYVYPGDRLRLHCWQNGNQIIFSLLDINRNEICTKGVVELWETPRL